MNKLLDTDVSILNVFPYTTGYLGERLLWYCKANKIFLTISERSTRAQIGINKWPKEPSKTMCQIILALQKGEYIMPGLDI